MKKSAVVAAGFVLLVSPWLQAADEAPRTFQGEIGDSQCALNIHSLTRSHKEMLKSKAMGGDAATCAAYCTKYLGGNYVLVVKNDVYHLDDQTRAQELAGKQVKVTGTLDPKAKTIHVLQMEPK
jgi:hypothetical protein